MSKEGTKIWVRSNNVTTSIAAAYGIRRNKWYEAVLNSESSACIRNQLTQHGREYVAYILLPPSGCAYLNGNMWEVSYTSPHKRYKDE